MSTTSLTPSSILAVPVIQKAVETFDWETANVRQESDDRTQLVPQISPVLEASSTDYSPSLKLAEEINQINQIRKMRDGTLSPSILPTAASPRITATAISVGISTLLAQTTASASLATTTTTTTTTSGNTALPPTPPKSTFVSAQVAETMAGITPTSLPSPPSNNQEATFSTIHNTTAPYFPHPNSTVFLQQEDTVVKVESTDLPMTPPPSQEFQEPYDPLDSSFEYESTSEPHGQHNTQSQRKQQHQQSFHPFDKIAPSAPKKTLNWVNAVPSHFNTPSADQPRKRRRRTNREELEILEDAFAKNLLPDAATRQELGERLGMSVRAVQIWFQNRRQMLRKKSISGGIGGAHQGGSEEDLPRSDDERSGGGGGESHRRSSGDSNMSASPVLLPSRGQGHVSRLSSRSCSNLMSSSPPTRSQRRSSSLMRADNCSALPVSVSPLTLPLASPPLGPATPFGASAHPEAHREPAKECAAEVAGLVVVKTEEPEEIFCETLTVTKETPQELTDIKTADHHLNMLLQEAKRRSGQCNSPVMAIWSEKSSKPVLNADSLSGSPPSGTTFFPATAPTTSVHRSMSTPTIRSSATDYSVQPLSIPSQSHSRSAASKSARKHRSMPEPLSNSTSNRYCPPYPRTMSLMEQVINRQKHQHQPHPQHHHRPAPSNFKQSTLSRNGKHTIDSVANRASQSLLSSTLPSTATSSVTSTGISTVELARRLQLVMGNSFKRIQSQSQLTTPASPAPAPATTTPATPTVNATKATTGQPAMRARRLSIGKYLFDSDTEDERRNRTSTSSRKHVQQSQQQPARFPSREELTHQAQKRTARAQMTSTNGDETDEEDFREQAKKRLSMAKKFATAKSFDLGMNHHHHHQYQHQHPRQRQHSQDNWSGVHKMPRKGLRPSMSTMSLVTSSPTREYGLELEQASRGPPTSFPIMERNRSWGGVHSVDKPSSSPLSGATPAKPDDMNMDEIECANVLAGLGWGR
ncbi:hypothetical protein BGX23_008213 [Mortierella sp. AD031]|nr:hypothetical protein BGX23_008213 [Mortierella sp. AD031]